MELNQIFKKLLGRGCPYEGNQTALAERLGVDQSLVSKLHRRTLPAWEDHWAVSLRLLPICDELGIDPAQDLEPPTAEGVIQDVQTNGSTTGGPLHRAKAKTKKKGHGALQAGGIKSGRR